MGYIYILTSPYGKPYIGQTIRPIKERFKEHQTKPDCVAIYGAIKKHGWDKMKKEWIEVPDDELNFYEEMLVALLGTIVPNGYNLKEGGGSGRPCEEVKKKMSESKKSEKNPFYGMSHTDEAKQKISIANIGKTLSDEHKQILSDANSGENNFMFGRTHTDEARNKISESMTGRNHTDEVKQQISESNSGEKNHNSKKVYQYSIDGLYINSFASSGEAARSLNKMTKNPGCSIRECARGKNKSAHGFKWSYTVL